MPIRRRISRLKLIREFAMRRAVQPKRLLLLWNPQADGEIDGLEDHPGCGAGECDHDKNRHGLFAEQAGVSVKETICPDAVDRFVSEEPSRDRAPYAADAVDR